MTTPQPPQFGADTAGSRLLGVNALQGVVDKLTQAVDKMASVAQSMSTSGPGGSTTTFHSTGQTFTAGSFPKMTPAAAGFSGGASYATQPGQTMNNPAQTLNQMASNIGSNAMSALVPSGSKYSSQILMNQYASMSSLGFGPGVNLGQGFSAMYRQAFGSYNANANVIAFGAADAAQGASTLQGIAGSPYIMNTALGRAGYSSYAGVGISNPSLGAAGSAQAAQTLYDPMTSMRMRMMGYGATPRGLGGTSPTQMGGVVQSLFQRWYGRNSARTYELNQGLAVGGIARANLQAAGLDPNIYGPSIQMYNKLFRQGVSANQADAMLSAASHNGNYNGTSAQKLLSNKYGIATSDLQKLKDTSALQTSRMSGEMGGFDSALSQATTTIQHFDKAINAILRATGIGTAMGFAHGMSGTMSAVGGVTGKLFQGGMRMLGTLTGISGGAGPAVGTGGHGTPGSTTGKMSGVAATAIKSAESQLGRPYVWGGDNPGVGFDCSGLVEWAYAQAGIKLPRTSEAQWAALRNRAVPLGKVQAGDILFSAGSDGTPNNPGHEAMAISSKQIIEAPYTGANIRIRALNAGEWSHAARPNGSLSAGGSGGGGTSGSNGNSSPSTSVGQGNGGLGLAVGTYGSSSEVDNIASALLGGISGGSGGGFGSVGNGQGSAQGGNGSGKGNMNVSTTGGGSRAANRRLGQRLAKQMYGWTGKEWSALDSLWGTYESGWNSNAQNPGSTAFGIAQFLDSTWKPYGPKTSNPGLQIKYGLEYIHDRYKDPIRALQFELSHNPHWYGDGTRHAREGLALVGERGPELVKLGGGQQVMNASKTADILKGSHARPGQTPWDTHTALGLYLAPMPQNTAHHAGKCEVHLHMPKDAIRIHTQGSPSDVSNAVRQIMQGISEAMANDEMVKRIMSGVMG